MTDATIVFLVLGAVVVLFVWNKFPVEVVALGSALALAGAGVISAEETVVGFGSTTVVFIAALFVVSEGLDATGVTTWVGQALVARVGESRVRLMVLTMLLVALLTALISVNGSVAALLPMAVVMAVRVGRSPSELLIPLAFAAHAGSMLALTGTPVNILVSDAAIELGFEGFSFFEFALAGIPLLVGVVVIILVLGPYLLPKRQPKTIKRNLSDHARVLYEQYVLDDRSIPLKVGRKSVLVDTAVSDLDLSPYPGASLVSVKHADPQEEDGARVFAAGDVLIVVGDAEDVKRLAHELGLTFDAVGPFGPGHALVTREIGVVEVVIPPRSALIGEAAFPGMVTESGEFIILGIQRRGETLEGDDIILSSGDVLLLQGMWAAIDERIESDPDVLVVDAPGEVRRQIVPMGAGAQVALAILVGMVVLMATGWTSSSTAALLAAGALIVSRVLTIEQAYRSVSWTTVVLVGGMMPLSNAMYSSGAATTLADYLVSWVGDMGPHAMLIGLFLLTAALGQLISNMATVLVVIPVAISAAADMGLSVRPVLMSLTIAAAAALLTPVATPANLMVMGPGGYQFGDYWKLGLPLLAWFFVISVFWVPVVWPF